MTHSRKPHNLGDVIAYLLGFVLVAILWLVPGMVGATTINFDIATSADDGSVRATGGSYPPTNLNALNTTSTTQSALKQYDGTHYVDTMIMRWDTSALGSAATITGVNLYIKIIGLADTDSRNLVCEWMTDAPLAQGDWTAAVGTTAVTIALATLTNAVNNTVALSGFNDSPGLNRAGYSKMRCGISGAASTNSDTVTVASYDNVLGHQIPELQVTYTLPTATPTVTNTPTPTSQPILNSKQHWLKGPTAASCQRLQGIGNGLAGYVPVPNCTPQSAQNIFDSKKQDFLAGPTPAPCQRLEGIDSKGHMGWTTNPVCTPSTSTTPVFDGRRKMLLKGPTPAACQELQGIDSQGHAGWVTATDCTP